MAIERIDYKTPYFDPSPSFYSGTAYSGLVPYPFPVSIDGHAYQLQWDSTAIGVWGARFKKNSLPLLRTQADSSNTPGEQSISPEQFWRRSQDSWQFGAGQIQLDRTNSDLRRYNWSNGIDPWTPWELKLLNDTTNVYTSANTGLQCLVASTYVYMIDSSNLKFSSGALSSWTSVTGMAGSPLSMATDGNTIWTANDTNGIYSGTVAGSSVSSYATGTATLVRFVKSRLMAAGGGKLYNITASGALPTALLDLSARNFTWVDIASGESQIYAAGYSGDKSLVYRTAIKADGTALDVPTVAAELPDGEIVRSLGAYLGYILIGSDLGVRFCSTNTDGSLTIGSLIQTKHYDTNVQSPVYCFEGQDRFIWFGWSNYDENTGLGRMDLTNFTSALTPAYASDLMVQNSTGTVRSVATFNNKRIFTVDGKGLYIEASTPVTSGYLVSGVISYGISDPKVAMYLDIKHEPLVGSITAGIIADQSDSDLDTDAVTTIGVSNIAGSVSPESAFPCGQLLGENFQIILTLTSDGTTSPVLSRYTLRSYPAPVRSAQWDVPIILAPIVVSGDKDWSFNVNEEVDFLVGLHQAQSVVTFQFSNAISQVVMYDYQWLPEAIDVNGNPRGIFYAQLREIVG
jgi:hypothetical protein